MEQKSTADTRQPWWHDFFDETYGRFGLATVDPKLTEQTVDFLFDRLDLSAGQVVLDQCCGIGRLSLPLAERGVHVVGVDLSRAYIERATAEAARRGLPCKFYCADAFDFTAVPPCDAAINWFTSFGYAEDDGLNVRMLHRVFDSLKPGGAFALDYINILWLIREFQPSRIARADPDDADGLVVLQEARPDLARGMLRDRWTFVFPDGSRQVRWVRTRMHLPHVIASMLQDCGFVDVELFGSVQGEPLDLQTPRCIAVGRKPGG